jgi:VanZ family protein
LCRVLQDKRFTISSNTTNSIAASRWNGLAQLIQFIKQIQKVARVASLCLVLYWLLIFTGTHLPSHAVPRFNLSDKVCHALAFGGLAFLLSWAIPSRGKNLTHVLWAAMIALVYGVVDEWTQNFIPGRVCDVWDMAADAVGVGLGVVCYLLLRQLLLQWKWGRQFILGMARY